MRRGALALGAVAIVGYLVDYGFNLGLARFLDPHEYGDFKVAFSFAYFLGLAVLLGGDRAAPMVLAPCLEKSQPRKVWEYLRFYLARATALGLAAIAVTWILGALHLGTRDPEDHHALSWAVVAVPLNAAAALISRTLQSSHRIVQAVVPWRIGLPLLQLGLLAAVAATTGELGVHEALVLCILAAVGIFLGQWLWVLHLGLVELEREPSFRKPREWLAASLPMMGAFLAALALSQSDLYFLELLADEDAVGHYAAISMAAHFVPLVQVTLVGLIAPIAGAAMASGAEASRAAFRRGQTLLLAGLVPVTVFLVLAGEPILGLFGSLYRADQRVLHLLVAGLFAWALAALPSLWLQYQGRGRVVLLISIATLLVDSVLNLLWIPRYGIVGAAGGTALTLGAAALAVSVVFWRSRVIEGRGDA